MKRRVWLAAGLLAAAAGLGWWLMAGRPDPSDSEARAGGVARTAPAGTAAPLTPARVDLILAADGGIRPDPASVRIGLAMVPPQEGGTHREMLARGATGNLPDTVTDLAVVQRWIEVPTTVLGDGSLRVGPVELPPAHRYDLQAGSSSDLHHYFASFAAAPPARVQARAASGIRLAVPPGQPDVRVRLLQPSPPADHPAWQRLLAHRAPAVLAAFRSTPMAVAPGTRIAPLAPGNIQLIVEVAGIEALRRPVQLPAGRWVDVALDAAALAEARRQAVDVALEFVRSRDGSPVEGLQATLVSGEVEQGERTDRQGIAVFADLDRRNVHQWRIEATAPRDGLPEWPEAQTVQVDPAELAGGEIVRKRVELVPLRWILVAAPRALAPSRENPYPVYLLQERRDGQWSDRSAAHFIPIPDGMAVSITEAGEYRIIRAESPWRTAVSAPITAGAAEPRVRTRIAPSPGRTVTVLVAIAGQAVANAPVLVVSPRRGMPPVSIRTDANGLMRLEGVTTDQIFIELPGRDQRLVDLRQGRAIANFR